VPDLNVPSERYADGNWLVVPRIRFRLRYAPFNSPAVCPSEKGARWLKEKERSEESRLRGWIPIMITRRFQQMEIVTI
jgi:hypothetical protein